jgi:predicted permease
MNAALFWQNAALALRQIIILYVIVAMGVLAERLKWFPEATARACSKLLFYVITPCVIVRSFLNISYSPETLRGLGISVACGFLLHIVGLLLSEPFFRGKKNGDIEPILHFTAMYGNCGYMALPLAQALVGELGVFYCSAVILTFQVFCFTHGAFTMSGGLLFRSKKSSAAQSANSAKFDWKKLILNAGVLSVLVGLPLFLLRAPIPKEIAQPIDYVASMNTPLAMLMFGAYLSHASPKAIVRSPKIALAGAIKLFAIPAVVLTALLLCGVRGPLLQALIISASAPSANNTVVFAATYNRDARYAAQVVGIISIVSILTMPLIMALGLSVN